MFLNARRMRDIILLTTFEMPQRALSYSWSWVGSHGNGIENMATLSIGERGSYLYGPQKLEVYFHPTGSEHEAKKMTRVDKKTMS
jgi:hypothetical protein